VTDLDRPGPLTLSWTAATNASPDPEASSPESAPGTGRRPGRAFWCWLGVIVAAGLALRIGIVWHEQGRLVGGDGFGYHLQTVDLLDGKGFINPFNRERSALHPPVWALVLTAVTVLKVDSWLDHQLFSAVLGSSTVLLVGLAGRRIGGDRTGLIAAGIAAIYTGLWIYERSLLSETLLMTIIAATILLAYAFRARPTTGKVVGLALLFALMALTRSEQALAIPLLLVPLVVGARRPDTGERLPPRQRLVWGGVAAAVIVACLIPWATYTWSWLGHPVVLSDGFGNATRVANCDPVYFGEWVGSYDTQCNLGPEGPVQARSYALEHVGRWPAVVLAREGRTWGFWAPFQQVEHDRDWQKSALVLNQIGLFEFWVLAPLAACGVVVLRRRRIPVYPLLTFVLVVVVTAAITFGETRYRASAEVSIVLLAAVSVDALISGLRARARPARPSGTAVPA
jgi:4-amino-4-deoxy-L-arabinose transferase-like glycosyltransferase